MSSGASSFQQHIAYLTAVFFSQCPPHEVERVVSASKAGTEPPVRAFIESLFHPPDAPLARGFRSVLSKMYALVIPRELRPRNGFLDSYITLGDCMSAACRVLYRQVVPKLNLDKTPGEIISIIIMWIYQELMRLAKQEAAYFSRKVYPAEDSREEDHLGTVADLLGFSGAQLEEDGLRKHKRKV